MAQMDCHLFKLAALTEGMKIIKGVRIKAQQIVVACIQIGVFIVFQKII